MPVAIDTFTPRVLRGTRGIPEILVGQAVVDAAVEFCHRSRIWKVDLPNIVLQVGVQNYTPVYPANSQLVEAESALIDGGKARLYSFDEVRKKLRLPEPGVSGQPFMYEFDMALHPAPVMLNPICDAANAGRTVTLRVSLKPTDDATQLPDILSTRYAEAVAAGARARLLAMPDEVWSNPGASDQAMGVFERGIGQAASDAYRKGVVGSTYARVGRAFGR